MKSRNNARTRVVTVALLALGCSCTEPASESEPGSEVPTTVEKIPWGEVKGQTVDLYTLSAGGIIAKVTNYGTILTELHLPDQNGIKADVVLGFDSLEPYLPRHPYFGCIVGRVANRIGKGRFLLDDQEYNLVTNWQGHHLHGGEEGFDRKVWKVTAAEQAQDQAILSMTYSSPDGEEGYPGTLETSVTYRLSGDTLELEMVAQTDAATIVNLSNHTYWNLAGHGSGDILGHQVQLNSDFYTPADETGLPIGEIRSVAGTPYDFTQPKTIGKDIEEIQLRTQQDPRGYDVNYVVRGPTGELKQVARVVEPTSGRTLTIYCTEPGVQFYSGNYLDGSVQGKGHTYEKHAGFCLETQGYPDAINKEGQPGWPSIILRPGETYRHLVRYRFSEISGEIP